MRLCRAGCPFVISQKDEKKFKEFLENPERLIFVRRIMTAQRTKNTAFIEKRHNADCGLDKFIPRIKRGYHMLISKDERRLAKPPPYNDECVIMLYPDKLLG